MWKQPLDTLQLQYASTELLARVLGFQENYQFCGEWNLPRMAYDADADRLRSTRASDHVLPGLGVTATLRHGVAGNSATRFGYDAARAFTNGTSSPGAAWQSVDVSDGDANVDVIATFSTPVQPCVVRIYWTDAPAMDFDIEYETPTGAWETAARIRGQHPVTTLDDNCNCYGPTAVGGHSTTAGAYGGCNKMRIDAPRTNPDRYQTSFSYRVYPLFRVEPTKRLRLALQSPMRQSAAAYPDGCDEQRSYLGTAHAHYGIWNVDVPYFPLATLDPTTAYVEAPSFFVQQYTHSQGTVRTACGDSTTSTQMHFLWPFKTKTSAGRRPNADYTSGKAASEIPTMLQSATSLRAPPIRSTSMRVLLRTPRAPTPGWSTNSRYPICRRKAHTIGSTNTRCSTYGLVNPQSEAECQELVGPGRNETPARGAGTHR